MMEPGDTVGGRFVVEGLLGEGGIARVYKVRHLQLGSVHALKVLTMRRRGMAERLLLEGQIQAQLRHPNVVSVTDVVEEGGFPGLLMEYVDAMSLEEWLTEYGTLPLPRALDLYAQILAGVHAAHTRGVLHRDLKPSNILLARTPQGLVPKVSDFGIAKVAAEDAPQNATRAGTPMGSPGYMAPEQVTDASTVDERADIWALGVILYEVVSGARAFFGSDTLAILNRTVKVELNPIREVVDGVPDHVVAALDGCLQSEMEGRFATVLDLARVLFADDPDRFSVVEGRAMGEPMPLAFGESISQPLDRIATTGKSKDTGTWAPAEGNFTAVPEDPEAVVSGTGRRRSVTVVPTDGTLEASQRGDFTADGRPTRSTGRPGLLAYVLGGLVLAGSIGVGGWLATRQDLAPVEGVAEPVVEPPRSTPTVSIETVPPVASEAEDVVEASQPEADATEPVVEAAAPEPVRASAPPARTAEPPPAETQPAEPEPEEPVVAEPQPVVEQPPPEPVVEAPEPDVAEVAPEAPEPAPRILGNYTGKANGRPLVVRITTQDGTYIAGSVEFVLGTTRQEVAVAGSVSSDGSLNLKEDAGSRLVLTGTVSGGTLSGSYTRSGQRKALGWSASR